MFLPLRSASLKPKFLPIGKLPARTLIHTPPINHETTYYASGREGLPKDREKAVHWAKKSAEQGNADAQCFLGVSYLLDGDTPQDITNGIILLRKSAEQGYANAQYLLETAYLTGHIVPKDVRTTRDWFQKAAAQGYQPAPEMLQSHELR
ncbi:tetratricopeptide repeat protein [Bombella apis]|uniref:tetratricopeptide repeat protein n=1 Tax=Bombella apis TaxID=1785988 RepID=UPI0012B97DF1|nr:tetratricopeptide repeat protein [Bombella apis]MPW00736.1 hypothetical protein [Bombella apis]